MDIQERYWRTMVQIKFSEYYIDLYYENSVKIDRSINMFLALVACGSIASWAVWSQFAFVWATLVALSQVVNVIKPYLPYSNRVDELFTYTWDLCELYRKIEFDWLNVSNGDLTENEINKLINKYKSEYIAISKKYLCNDYLTNNGDYKVKADSLTNEYFKNNF